MAVLTQKNDVEAYYMGWYGQCGEDCSGLSLTIPFIREKLYKVYQISDDNVGYRSFDGTLPTQYDNIAQHFTQLECGRCYIVVLKPGTGSIDVPQFIQTKIDTVDAGRIVEDCQVNLTPTPTPTTTPTSTPTPTPTIAVSQTPTPTPTSTPPVGGVPGPSHCEGYPHTVVVGSSEVIKEQVRFTSFPDDNRICFWGATGGVPNGTMVRLSGKSTPEGRIAVNGQLNNNSIKYITTDGKIYRGTFKNAGIFTDLILT